MGKAKRFLVLLLCQSALLAGCSSDQDKWQQQLSQQVLTTETKLSRLKKHIEAGHISNVTVLKQYADIVKQHKPEVAQLVDALAQDASTHGPIIRSLESRLSDAKSDIPNALSIGYESVNKVYQELSSIETAANPDTYGMILSDPINVLADMSVGQLARVAAMSQDASARINNADDFGAGSQLVGNPNYGSWQSGSGGSFWQWYGQYAFFSSLFHRPIYYSSWGRYRDYSYYNDYGRSAYTSPAQRRGQESVQRRTQDKFNRSGKTFNSPYAKTKHTTAQVARTQSRLKSANNAKTMARSASKTTSSYRSSSYQSSRSSFGGK
jgi:outer membrane murein-binding lipoprotein Lpp